MGLFLSILEGQSPTLARPIVATGDPVVIAAAIQALAGRLSVPSLKPIRRKGTVADQTIGRVKA